ncbi:MAG: tetratricopeptide repeat protein, partial [Panacagrimonas sp.]
MDLAARLAQIHIERSRSGGDPRELGYAQGLLAPWWDTPAAPAPILILRATLKQARHDFSGALRDLDQLLRDHPNDVQARLTQATVLRVQGRYPQALQACAQLQPHVNRFIGTLCEQSLRGLGGELETASAALDVLQDQVEQQDRGVAAWYFAERADMALRAGADEQARALYRTALQRFPADLDLMASHADLLLD